VKEGEGVGRVRNKIVGCVRMERGRFFFFSEGVGADDRFCCWCGLDAHIN